MTDAIPTTRDQVVLVGWIVLAAATFIWFVVVGFGMLLDITAMGAGRRDLEQGIPFPDWVLPVLIAAWVTWFVVANVWRK